MIVVWRLVDGQRQFLVMHRGQFGPDWEDDWAWGPPSGARHPGEPIEKCARRELLEETGYTLPLTCVTTSDVEWQVYLCQATVSAQPQLSEEHDRYLWLGEAEAAARITPDTVRTAFQRAAAAIESLEEHNKHPDTPRGGPAGPPR